MSAYDERLHPFLLRNRVRLLDLDCAPGFSIREDSAVIYYIEAGIKPAPSKELRELVSALEMFVENYRLMHAGTAYGQDVETAAADVRAKLNEL